MSNDLSERLANKKLSMSLFIFFHVFFLFFGQRGFLDKRGQKGFNKPDVIYQEPKLQKLFEEISSLGDLSDLITELAYK